MRFLRRYWCRRKSIGLDKLYAHIVDDELSAEGHRRLGHTIVSEWIDCATRGLCEDARERIRKEIEAHYEEAVSEYRENGGTLKESHKAAIRSLGSPERARRVYRKTYLTAHEWQCIDCLTRADSLKRRWFWYGMGLLNWLYLVAFGVGGVFRSNVSPAIVLIFGFVAVSVTLEMARRSHALAGTLKWAVREHLVLIVTFSALLLLNLRSSIIHEPAFTDEVERDLAPLVSCLIVFMVIVFAISAYKFNWILARLKNHPRPLAY